MEHIRLRLCKISIMVMTIFVIAFLKGCGKTQDNLIAADNNQNNENEVNYEGEWYRTDVPSYEWAKITISNWIEGESFDVTLLANYADYGGPVEGTAVFISEDTAVVYDENVIDYLEDSESDAGVYLQFADGEIIVTHSEDVRLWFGGGGFATAEGRYIKGEPEYTNCTDVSTIFSEAELEEIEKLLGDDYETMFEWVVEMGEIEECSLSEGTLWKAYYPPYGAAWCNILINNDGSIYMEGSYWGTDYWFHSNTGVSEMPLCSLEGSVNPEEKEIACDNPYFFSPDVSSLTADITFCGDECFMTIRGDLELHWLKQYENGCIAKLSLLPSDDIPEYSYLFDGLVTEDYEYCDIYFYVTSDEIYRMNCYVVQDGEYVYAYDDEDLFLTLLDSEEKIIENAELVCCPERIESEYTGDNIGDPFMIGEIGTHYEIVVSENQITYCRQEYPAGHMEFYNTFVWENGRGLVEHKRGYRAGALVLYIENITAE